MDECRNCRNYHPTLEAFERDGAAQASVKFPPVFSYCRTEEDRDAYARGYARGKGELEAFEAGYEAGAHEKQREEVS